MSTQLDGTASKKQNTAWQILVVDDEAQCANLFAKILRNEGYTVRTASTGNEALQKLRKQPADLVLADMAMPGMNGIELLANIKERYPETDVIILTGFGTIEDSLEAMRRGAADFLPKPFQPHELTRLTASCLRAKRATSDEAFLIQSRSMIELTHLLTQSTDMQAMPSRAVELACSNFAADSAILLAYDATLDRFSVMAQAGASFAQWDHTGQPSRHALKAIRERGTVLSAEPGSGDCFAYVPLLIGGRARGLLCMRRGGGPWFHEKSSELLEIFGTHLALALESARLYETAAHQVRDLEDMIVRSRSLTFQLDPDDLYRQLLQECARMEGVEIAALLLADAADRPLRTLPDLAPGTPLYDAILARMSSLAADASEGPTPLHPGTLPAEVRSKLAAFLHVPVISGPRRFGLLAVFTSRAEGFPMDAMQRLSTLAGNAATALHNAANLSSLSARYHESLELIGSSVDSMNLFGAGHSRQVSIFAGELARQIGLDAEEIHRIEDGALLHDIGKICIPLPLLRKPGPLTAEEYAIVKTHPVHGAMIFQRTPHLADLLPIVRHHHEHYDGTGYPDGLAGDAIPRDARIVALGDVFDALISKRSYRPPIKVEQARRMIELKSGSQFDPYFAEVFLTLPLENLIQH